LLSEAGDTVAADGNGGSGSGTGAGKSRRGRGNYAMKSILAPSSTSRFGWPVNARIPGPGCRRGSA